MNIAAFVDENTDEMEMSLKLDGRNAATTPNLVLLYAQIEDPLNPGIYESFTCSTRLDKSKVYLEYDDVIIKNYYGSKSLKEGNVDVTDKTAATLNPTDLKSVLPWKGLLDVGGEDTT